MLLLVSAWLCCHTRYRLPNQQPQRVFYAEVVYPMVQLQLVYRTGFEALYANKPIQLQGQPLLYVKRSDYAKLWPESPIRLYQNHQTLKATLLAQPLLFGGYAIAQVITIEHLSQKPRLSK